MTVLFFAVSYRGSISSTEWIGSLTAAPPPDNARLHERRDDLHETAHQLVRELLVFDRLPRHLAALRERIREIRLDIGDAGHPVQIRRALEMVVSGK